MSTNLDVFGFLAPAQAPDEIGRLGPYRVLKVLGQGGMGVVFEAEDPQLERTVALKAMLPEVAKRPVARERFLREARATAKIEHDHIVTIYQVGEDRGVPFLAMQLLKGMSLEDYLKKKYGGKAGKPLPLDTVIKLGREIAKGLAAAHDKGLIHRDIKPANIWLDASAGGRVKILDFGLARANEGDTSGLTKVGTIVGSPSYMAPEQARSDKVDARADLFSLGCVLYRLCTGRLPFRGEDAVATMVAAATEEPPAVRDLNPEVPPTLAELVRKCLAKKPEDRPASARAVIEAIQAIEAEQPTLQMKKLVLPTAEPIAPVAAVASVARAEKTMWQEPGESASMIPRRPRQRSGSPLPILATVGALVILAGVIAAGAFFYFQTDTGTLKIDLAGNDVQVVVERDGKKIGVLDKKNGKLTLPSGDYHLRLSEPRKDLRLHKETIRVARDEVVAVALAKVEEVTSTRPGARTRPDEPAPKTGSPTVKASPPAPTPTPEPAPAPPAPPPKPAADKDSAGEAAGILFDYDRKNNFITVKVDGDEKLTKYLVGGKPDNKLAESLKTIFGAHRVQLSYKKDGDNLVLGSIRRHIIEVDGTITGTVVKVHNNFWVEVKPKEGLADAFAPGANYNDKAFMAKLRGLQLGDLVTITYTTDGQRHRIKSLTKN
jgi:serine/threonine protein kinase